MKRISIVRAPIPFTVLLICLSGGAVSKVVFADKANYIEMINTKIRAVLFTFTDADLEDCDTTREALSEMLTHGMQAAAIIHANCMQVIDWI